MASFGLLWQGSSVKQYNSKNEANECEFDKRLWLSVNCTIFDKKCMGFKYRKIDTTNCVRPCARVFDIVKVVL